ncbi:MAG: WD40 repeat domain-containing protein [Thermonemataceae bacterium]|nr:WD40 repeat domain-containing protein [Thermonemataceae bacterium]
MENTSFLDFWKNYDTKADIKKAFSNNFPLKPLSSFPKENKVLLREEALHHNFIGGLLVTDKFLFTSSEDNSFKMLSINNLELIREFRDHQAPVNFLALSPDGAYLAAATDDYKIYVYETAKWTLHKTLKGHKGYVSKIEFTNDSLVSISKDGTVKIWDYIHGKLLFELLGHEEWVYALAVSPQKDRIITGALNSSLKLWDARTGTLLQDLIDGTYLSYVMGMTIGGNNHSGKGNKQSPNAALWLPNGKVATLSNDIVMWDDSTWQVLWHKSASVQKIKRAAYIAEYNMLITASEVIQGWNADTGELLFEEVSPEGTPCFSCAIDNNKILYTGDEKGMLRIWDIEALLRKGIHIQHTSSVHRTYWHKNSQTIYSESYYSAIAWDKYGKAKKNFSDFKESDKKITGEIPQHPYQIFLSARGEIKIFNSLNLEEENSFSLDNDLVGIEKICSIGNDKILSFGISYKPRLINLITKEIQRLDTACSFYTKADLSEKYVLFSSYPGQTLDEQYPEQNPTPLIECGFSKDAKERERYKNSSPVFLFNTETAQVEKEYWLPQKAEEKVYPYSVQVIDKQTFGASYSKKFVIWDINGEIKHTFYTNDYWYLVAAYEQSIYLIDENQLLLTYSLHTFEKIKETHLPFIHKKARLVFDKIRNILAIADGKKLILFDITTSSVIFEENINLEISHLNIADDLLIIGTNNGMIYTFEWSVK